MRTRIEWLIFSVAVVTVVTLLVSFGLHAVQVDHVHYGTIDTHVHTESGVSHEGVAVPVAGVKSLGEKMHVSDKKWLVALVATAFVLWLGYGQTVPQRLIASATAVSLLRRRLCRTKEVQNSYLHWLYSLGKLNPKVH